MIDFLISVTIPPMSAVKGMKSVLFLCLCLSVSALLAEPFDLWAWNSARGLTLKISRMISKLKCQNRQGKNKKQ